MAAILSQPQCVKLDMNLCWILHGTIICWLFLIFIVLCLHLLCGNFPIWWKWKLVSHCFCLLSTKVNIELLATVNSHFLPAKCIPWAPCQIRKIAGAHVPGMLGTFSPPPQVNDPNMHQGTCVAHVPWCMLGSLTSGFLWSRWVGKTFPAFPAHAQPAILRIW